jgi:hypothetical protein
VSDVLNRTRDIFAVLGVTAIVATGLFVVSPSASANGSICNPGCEAQADFRAKKSKKEVLIVHDLEEDGHSGVGVIEVFDQAVGQWLGFDDAAYFNTRGFEQRPKRFKLRIPNGTRVRYQACVGDRDAGDTGLGEFLDCSLGWRYDVAGRR